MKAPSLRDFVIDLDSVIRKRNRIQILTSFIRTVRTYFRRRINNRAGI
jgi:hypothetical protein